ncbi:hypothetical protein [Cupriavidus basilensis]
MDDMREALKHGDKTGTGGVLISNAMARENFFHQLCTAEQEAEAKNPQCIENADNLAAYVIV